MAILSYKRLSSRCLVAALIASLPVTPVAAATVPPARITVRLSPKPPNNLAQVALERDQGSTWQQYLDTRTPAADGTVTFSIQVPGTYWLLGSSRINGHVRRGACLVQVDDKGRATFRKLPRTRQGRKWGGVHSASCAQQTISLVPLHTPMRKHPLAAKRPALKRKAAPVSRRRQPKSVLRAKVDRNVGW